MKQSVVIHENPIIFTPDLARIIGLNGAIVFQKLEFLLSIKGNGVERDGYRWIFNTYKEWQSDFFPFWSISTIERTFLNLEKMALIESIQPEGRGSRIKYYRTTDASKSILNTDNIPKQFPEDVKLTDEDEWRQIDGLGRRQIDGFLYRSESPESHIADSQCSSAHTVRKGIKPISLKPKEKEPPKSSEPHKPEKEKKSPAQKREKTAEEFLEELRPLYPKIDIDSQFLKMKSWILANPHKRLTKRFMVNWLNRTDVPLAFKSNGSSHPESDFPEHSSLRRGY